VLLPRADVLDVLWKTKPECKLSFVILLSCAIYGLFVSQSVSQSKVLYVPPESQMPQQHWAGQW